MLLVMRLNEETAYDRILAMAVILRLKRFGKRSKATYRIVAIEGSSKRQGREVEALGTYDPSFNPPKINVNTKRVQYWLSVGAQTSETVKNLLKKTYGKIPKIPNT